MVLRWFPCLILMIVINLHPTVGFAENAAIEPTIKTHHFTGAIAPFHFGGEALDLEDNDQEYSSFTGFDFSLSYDYRIEKWFSIGASTNWQRNVHFKYERNTFDLLRLSLQMKFIVPVAKNLVDLYLQPVGGLSMGWYEMYTSFYLGWHAYLQSGFTVWVTDNVGLGLAVSVGFDWADSLRKFTDSYYYSKYDRYLNYVVRFPVSMTYRF